MFCSNCGKEISNQAKFCNHCGKPVNNAPVQSAAQAQPAPVKKKSNPLLTIVIFFVFAFVFTGVRTMAKKEQEDRWREEAQKTGKIEITAQDPTDAAVSDADIEKAMNSCLYGGLYQDDVLRYGMTRLEVPGYSLLPGEGEDRDWLMSPDGACLIAAYRQFEVLDTSYNASTEEGLLNSYKNSYGEASMISFKKYYVNEFPVIDYIVAYTADGVSQYQGELIIFPSETTNQTVRLAMFVDVSTGTSVNVIQKVFETLDVSFDYILDQEDTGTVGLNRITVK